MRIVDLSDAQLPAFLVCLEEWSEEMKEAGDHKAQWYSRMKSRGLRVKIALDERERAVGMIQYVRAQHAPIRAGNVYYVLCIWVHGHRQGVGRQQGKGIGTALLAAAEDDARTLGVDGLVTWGLSVPLFMRASWFKKHGYEQVDRDGLRALLFKPFREGVPKPRWLRQRKLPQKEADRVVVTACHNGWCQAQNITLERMRRAAAIHGSAVDLRVIDTCCNREALEAWGTDAALFVDDLVIRTAPPPPLRHLERVLSRRVRRKKTGLLAKHAQAENDLEAEAEDADASRDAHDPTG